MEESLLDGSRSQLYSSWPSSCIDEISHLARQNNYSSHHGSQGHKEVPRECHLRHLRRLEVETPERALIVRQTTALLVLRYLQFVLLARKVDLGYPLIYKGREALSGYKR